MYRDFSLYRIHKPRDSILSLGTGFNKYGGLINWGGLLLFLGGMRLSLENFNKYGNRVNPIDWVYLFFGHIFGNFEAGEYPTVFLILCKFHTKTQEPHTFNGITDRVEHVHLSSYWYVHTIYTTYLVLTYPFCRYSRCNCTLQSFGKDFCTRRIQIIDCITSKVALVNLRSSLNV